MLLEELVLWLSQVGTGLAGGVPRLGCVASSLAPGSCVRGLCPVPQAQTVGPANAQVLPGHQQPAVPVPTWSVAVPSWSVSVPTWVFKTNRCAELHSARTGLAGVEAMLSSQLCDLGTLPGPSVSAGMMGQAL